MNNDTFTGERSIWWHPADHLEEFRKITDWYIEAMKYCTDKRVLDLGAGHGFGSFLLSTVAKRVDAYDIKLLFDTSARTHTLPFICPSKAHHLDLETAKVEEKGDIAVAIEVIEHLANPDFMLENLRVDSLFFTVPCYGNKNEFHKIEYSEESCKTLVERHFPRLEYRMEKRRMIGIAHRV